MAGSKRQTSTSDTSEGDERGPERDPARVALDGIRSSPRSTTDEQRADQRQEGDDGEDGPARHQRTPANMNQVISAAAPISMAKA